MAPSLGNHDSEGLSSYSFFSLHFGVDWLSGGLAMLPLFILDMGQMWHGGISYDFRIREESVVICVKARNQRIRTLNLTSIQSQRVDF